MVKKKPKLLVVVGKDFDRSYAGTHYLLARLDDLFDLRVHVFTDAGRASWYSQLPFGCHAFPFRDSKWNRGRLRLMSKIFWFHMALKMLFAENVLITETAYLPLAALAKVIRRDRMTLAQFCQELAFPEEYPDVRWPAVQKRFAGAPDIVIDVDPFRAKIRAEYYHLANIPHVLRNTCPQSLLPSPALAGALWNLAQTHPPDGRTAIYAGGVDREKPFERIIDAIASLRHPVFLLAFCTASDERLRQLCDYAGRKLEPGRFAIRPSVSREKLLACLWEADVGMIDYSISVEPTMNQRYCAPTKLYEFMACGLAILGSNNDSLRDVIEREKIGRCAKGDDSKDLAMALDELLDQDVSAMKTRAKAVFVEKYSYEKICETEVQAIAKDILARRI